MKIRVGQTLVSTVDSTAVVVVRAPAGEVSVTCGGPEMVDSKSSAPQGSLDASQADGTQVGKRYEDEELGLELLCTKPGSGTLAVDGRALLLKGAKALPASD